VRRLALLIALGASVGGSSCVPVDGGAVEASWTIRSEDGRAISSCGCTDPAIANVRLRVVAQSIATDAQAAALPV